MHGAYGCPRVWRETRNSDGLRPRAGVAIYGWHRRRHGALKNALIHKIFKCVRPSVASLLSVHQGLA